MICTKCKKDKPEDKFNWKDKANGKKQSKCKVCTKEYRKKYYENNKKKALDYSSKSNRIIKERNRQFIWDYLKEHPCIDCGENNPIVLEFDHKDGSNKVSSISKMVQNQFSIENILKEIEKCDVRCANHHRIRTAEQFGWYKEVIK